MKIRSLLAFVALALWLATLPVGTTFAQKDNHPIITAEELLAKLDKGEKILILDLRNEGQYKSTIKRIKGDIRIEGDEDLYAKVRNVPPDRQIVTYCT